MAKNIIFSKALAFLSNYSDMVWNCVSIGVLSLSGLAFNLIIMHYYDAAVLGVFNQTYAWYIVLSQITVFGVQASTLKYVSELGSCAELKTVVSSAFYSISAVSVPTLILLAAFCRFLIHSSVNRELLDGLQACLPGLFFFAWNKVFLSLLNGLSKMKLYAVLQALRYTLIAVTLLSMAFTGTEGGKLPAAFTIAEFLLFLVSLFYLAVKKYFSFRPDRIWIGRHLRFGLKILPANFIMDLNTRVDVLCLGFFVSDYQIGVYSFAVLFAEGLYQIYIVVRRIINPQLAVGQRKERLLQAIKRVNDRFNLFIRFLLPLLGAVLCGVYLLFCKVLQEEAYMPGVLYLGIIAFAICVTGRSIVYGNLFSQTGLPQLESRVNICAISSNILLNLIFIFVLGTVGAAIATAISYVVFSEMLKRYAGQHLHVSLSGKLET